ncbi:MAG: ribosome-binding factor A [Rhodobacteraceae bacterium]|nr:ribosome-binding factor A [Paracoccaceae bacterium]
MSRRSHSPARGPSQRQLRVGELIRRTLSDVLARGEVHDPDLSRLSITVSAVGPKPPQKKAPRFFIPRGGGAPPTAQAAQARNRPVLRRHVGRALTLKFAPDLRFRLDETFDRMDATRRLFDDPTVARDVAAGDDAETHDAEPHDAETRDAETRGPETDDDATPHGA